MLFNQDCTTRDRVDDHSRACVSNVHSAFRAGGSTSAGFKIQTTTLTRFTRDVGETQNISRFRRSVWKGWILL